MDVLTINNVSKIYEKARAVDGISLSVPEQSIFGLLGPNGAGKTTLIRMITNILVQDTGSIELKNISAKTRNMYIGYMPEERGLYKKMKVGEQLMYLAQLKNLSRREAKKKLTAWLEKFGIEDWWHKKVEELSKGMQQKIQFIATVVHDPKLIILDEPFSGLDPINANMIKNEIFELKQKGATILFSTHRMEQVEEICECIALINKGKIVLSGSVADLKQQFKENKFKLTYKGHFSDIPEFLNIFEILEHHEQHLTLHLNEGYTPNDVLSYFIRQGLQIQEFKEILPSLNEIFINQVKAVSLSEGENMESLGHWSTKPSN